MPASDIPWALEDIADRSPLYDTFESYYDGDHPLLFATEKFRNTFGMLFQAFADNLCPTVIGAVSDRLNVDGFDGTHAQEATDFFRTRRLRRASNQLWRVTEKLGDGFLLVWPDNQGRTQAWVQEPGHCAVRYNDEVPGLTDVGAKAWITLDKHVRVTLYYPDHIERWQSVRQIKTATITSKKLASMDFAPYEGDDAGPEIANDHGRVPLFHFANCDEIGRYGRSELVDVIPLQNALNKSICDMLVAMEFNAFPQRFATGLSVEIDPQTGEPKKQDFVPGVDRVWTGGENVKFGEFNASDLKGYLEVQENIRKEIARVSGVPLHYLNLVGQYPSGEALKISEGRLVKKVEDRQVNFGDTLVDAIKLGLSMDGTSVGDDDELDIVWHSAAPNNPLLDSQTMLAKEQVGISSDQALRELGYSEDKIAKMKAEIEKQRMADAKLAHEIATMYPPPVAPVGGPGAKTPPASGQGGLHDPSTAAPQMVPKSKVPPKGEESNA